MYRLPRITIEAKPEHLALAASFASRIISPDYQWPRDGTAEVFVAGEQESMLLQARRSRLGVTVLGRYR